MSCCEYFGRPRLRGKVTNCRWIYRLVVLLILRIRRFLNALRMMGIKLGLGLREFVPLIRLLLGLMLCRRIIGCVRVGSRVVIGYGLWMRLRVIR